MKPRLTELNRSEILLYLGYRGQPLSPQLSAQIDRCADAVAAAAQPRAVFRTFPLPCFALPEGLFTGMDIQRHLQGCHTVILMAATLGTQVESLLMRTQISNLADAVIMDACASCAIENVCDNLESDLRLARPDEYLTDRFSPGYGDWPLTAQPIFCAVLDTPRRLGLTVSEQNLLLPRKSVTAALGVSSQPVARRTPGCAGCSMFLTCRFRKDGVTCGK